MKKNTVELHGIGGEDDGDETLSLSDLPLIHKNEESSFDKEVDQIQEDFDFCSVSKQPEMCAADQLFFRGQILPLRSVARSESMDHLHSVSGGLISSRSSSISSLQSSSSGSSSVGPKSRPRLPPARNQFHSHPSPSPRIYSPAKNHNHRNHSYPKKLSSSSWVWDVFRLGILTPPPEIAFLDLKQRANGRNFGSRNSTDSNGSSISGNINSNAVRGRNRGLLGGCKCSADAVDTAPARGAAIRRSASQNEAAAGKKQSTKKHLSHHRTFEWLKQLSLEDDGGCG